MQIVEKERKLHDEVVEKNGKDFYGAGILKYARDWADLMEKKLAEGAKVADIAESTSHEADTDGITGNMYSMAVSFLSRFWTHGEELRVWHNLDCQLGTEGEEANKVPGRTLNPAVLNIVSKTA